MIADNARPAGTVARQGGAAAPTGPWWCRHPKPSYPVPTGCRRVFIPVYGWLDADDDHRETVDKRFELPMVVLSLLVLPLLGLEFLAWQQNYAYVGQHIVEHPIARLAMDAAWVAIYLAFLVEFVVKISIARSRLDYVIKHWLDVVILVAPFLRAFRGLRALRAMKVTRLTRVLTLRGVATKLVRTALAMALSLRIVQRIKERAIRKQQAEPQHDYRRWSKAALIAEIHRLRAETESLRNKKNKDDVG